MYYELAHHSYRKTESRGKGVGKNRRITHSSGTVCMKNKINDPSNVLAMSSAMISAIFNRSFQVMGQN